MEARVVLVPPESMTRAWTIQTTVVSAIQPVLSTRRISICMGVEVVFISVFALSVANLAWRNVTDSIDVVIETLVSIRMLERRLVLCVLLVTPARPVGTRRAQWENLHGLSRRDVLGSGCHQLRGLPCQFWRESQLLWHHVVHIVLKLFLEEQVETHVRMSDYLRNSVEMLVDKLVYTHTNLVLRKSLDDVHTTSSITVGHHDSWEILKSFVLMSPLMIPKSDYPSKRNPKFKCGFYSYLLSLLRVERSRHLHGLCGSREPAGYREPLWSWNVTGGFREQSS